MPRNTATRRAPRCTKGFPCGSSCQAQGRRCNRPLPGQFSNHADWIASAHAVHGGGGSGGSGVATAGGSSGGSGATQSPAEYNPFGHRFSSAESQTWAAISPRLSDAGSDVAAVRSRLDDISTQKRQIEREQQDLDSKKREMEQATAEYDRGLESLKREFFPEGDAATAESSRLEEFSRRLSQLSGERSFSREAAVLERNQRELEAKKRDLEAEERWARRDYKEAESRLAATQSEMRDMMWRAREQNVAVEPQSPPPPRIINDRTLHVLRDYEESMRMLRETSDDPNSQFFRDSEAAVVQRREARERELRGQTVSDTPAPVTPSPAIAPTPSPSPVSVSQATAETAATPARRRGRPSAIARQQETEAAQRQQRREKTLSEAQEKGWTEEDIRKVQTIREPIPHREIRTNGTGALRKTTAAELISIGVKPPRDRDSIQLTLEERGRLREFRNERGGLNEREFLSKSPESDEPGYPIYSGERVRMYVSHGTVTFTVDGKYSAEGRAMGERLPKEELRMMKESWKHYLSQPRAKRTLDCTAYDGDGDDRYKMRLRAYLKMGFKEQVIHDLFSETLVLHNQFDLND